MAAVLQHVWCIPMARAMFIPRGRRMPSVSVPARLLTSDSSRVLLGLSEEELRQLAGDFGQAFLDSLHEAGYKVGRSPTIMPLQQLMELLRLSVLRNGEVAMILEHKYDQLQQMSDDPINQISKVFEKSMQYVKRFSCYKSNDFVKQVREILSRNQLAEFELCVLGNLCPETVEEAIAMVPSIKTKGRYHDDDAIEKMLHDLSLIKKFE